MEFFITLIVCLVALSIVLVIAFVIAPIVQRKFADAKLFWVRPPENTLAVVLKDNSMSRVVINCSDRKKTKRLEKKLAGTSITITPTVEGRLVWFGIPWMGYKLHVWDEHSRDQDRPAEKDPQTFLKLSERIWDYSAREWEDSSNAKESLKTFLEDWAVDTEELIQVVPKMAVTVEVINPQMALFGVTNFQEVVEKAILEAWRTSVGGLRYFNVKIKAKDGASQEKEKQTAQLLATDLRKRAQENLLTELGYPKGCEGIYDYGKIEAVAFAMEDIKDDTPEEEKGEVESLANKPIYRIFREVGVWIKTVRILDIDPAEDSVRENLRKRINALTEADSIETLAEGKSSAHKKEGEGLAEKLQCLINKKLSPTEAANMIVKMRELEKWDKLGKKVVVIESGQTSSVTDGARVAAGSNAVREAIAEEDDERPQTTEQAPNDDNEEASTED